MEEPRRRERTDWRRRGEVKIETGGGGGVKYDTVSERRPLEADEDEKEAAGGTMLAETVDMTEVFPYCTKADAVESPRVKDIVQRRSSLAERPSRRNASTRDDDEEMD